MSELSDGSHDVVVVDAREDEDGVVHLELAVTSGAHKGDVVHVAARSFARDALDVMGLPATIHVHEGVPRVVF
jgi:hypothetical protein